MRRLKSQQGPPFVQIGDGMGSSNRTARRGNEAKFILHSSWIRFQMSPLKERKGSLFFGGRGEKEK